MSNYPYKTANQQIDLARANLLRWITQIVILILAAASCAYLWQSMADRRVLALSLLIAAALALSCAVQMKWFQVRRRYREMNFPEVDQLLENITFETLQRMDIPTLICDGTGKILWYNRAFSFKNVEGEPIYAKLLRDIAGFDPDTLLSQTEGKGTPCVMNGYTYQVYAYPMERPMEGGFAHFPKHTEEGQTVNQQDKHQKHYITVWEDHTQEAAYLDQMHREDTTFTYVMIDNLQELAQVSERTYRGASAVVTEELTHWAQEMNGFLTDCGNDKYMLVCQAQDMAHCCTEKFPILDRVRALSNRGEEEIPLTVSIGVSRTAKTLQEKEEEAQDALDIALQRGGDQAVVRMASGLEFYGGRSKSVQKRTKVRSRVIANELIRLMQQSSNVLVMGHRNADFDALGACVGIARIAMHVGVPVNIVTNPYDENLRLCFESLTKLPEYSKMFLSGTDAQDLVQSGSLMVIVDVNNPRQFDSPDLVAAIPNRVVIDHHRKSGENQYEFKVSYIEPSASSTCELITELLEQTLPSGSLEKAEADTMYSGIILDTKQFMHNTGVRTFSSALYLRNEGADPEEAQKLFKTTLEDYNRLFKFEEHVEIYEEQCAIAYYDGEDGDNGDRVAAAKVADRLLNLQQVQASFVLCRIGDVICVSARSEGRWNVQIILEKLGGGGHYDAAGAQMKLTMPQAIEKLKAAIDTYKQES